MKRFLLWFLLFICPLFVVGGESRGKPVTDYPSLIDNLRAAGIIVKPEGEVVQPFFSVKGKIIKVGGEDVQVFQYSHETETDAQAIQVSPDGSTVGTTKIHWFGPPHFYKREKLLVLYVGDNEKVLKALEDVLGQQVAGQ
ncbi:MAG: hypothetical protein ACHBNF_17390 [Chromatiales bacterium]